MLVSIAILVIVIGLASAGVVLALQVQRTQEAVTSSQAKVRRVNEAVLQELRGAVLGGLASDPYDPDAHAVSFTQLEGGAGYQVLSATTTALRFVAEANPFGPNDQALLVDTSGNALVVRVSGSSALAGNTFRLTYPNCASAFVADADTLLFKVKTVGFRLDGDTLKQNVGGDEQPFAFGLSSFRVGYVYVDSGGQTVVEPDPYLDADGVPDRQGTLSNGNAGTLARLVIETGTTAKTIRGNSVTRSYTGQLELLDNVDNTNFRAIQGVSSCT